jgi:hypothetical protein
MISVGGYETVSNENFQRIPDGFLEEYLAARK